MAEDAFSALAKAMQVLPNVGAKTALRMTSHLLLHDREGAARLADALKLALQQVRHCALCNTFCESEICSLCADKTREHKRLMVVQMPADVIGMEAAHCHDGLYFILMGQVNPTQGNDLTGIAAEKLVKRIASGEVEEVILAMSYTAEGELTAHLLYEILKKFPCKISRLAKGIPLGGELEYIDAGTLAQAVYDRKQLKNVE